MHVQFWINADLLCACTDCKKFAVNFLERLFVLFYCFLLSISVLNWLYFKSNSKKKYENKYFLKTVIDYNRHRFEELFGTFSFYFNMIMILQSNGYYIVLIDTKERHCSFVKTKKSLASNVKSRFDERRFYVYASSSFK